MFAGTADRASYKETMIPYVIGCLVIFSAFTLWKIVVELGTSVESTTTQVVNTNNSNCIPITKPTPIASTAPIVNNIL